LERLASSPSRHQCGRQGEAKNLMEEKSMKKQLLPKDKNYHVKEGTKVYAFNRCEFWQYLVNRNQTRHRNKCGKDATGQYELYLSKNGYVYAVID
jgi:hypothetical protein